MTEAVREAFRKQASFCRALEAPFTATVLEAVAEVLNDRTETGARALAWVGDPSADVVPLRLAGGLHAMSRSGKDWALHQLYETKDGNFRTVLNNALCDWDHILCPWLDSPPQTNEVGRSGALMPGLMIAAERLGMPIELLEIGASAGLNLNLDRFHYRLGGRSAGPEDAQVMLTPEWEGPAPGGIWPKIIGRAGNDQNPLDVRDDEVAERLIAYCWPDQKERLARLEEAISLARAHPVAIEPGDAADWVETQLVAPQPEGTARILMHSVFWQYVPTSSQNRIEAAIRSAGAKTTADHPMAWLRFEPDPPELGPMQLRLDLWPSGDCLHLATCHPHGAKISWLG